jgi:hypothetical protein
MVISKKKDTFNFSLNLEQASGTERFTLHHSKPLEFLIGALSLASNRMEVSIREQHKNRASAQE